MRNCFDCEEARSVAMHPIENYICSELQLFARGKNNYQWVPFPNGIRLDCPLYGEDIKGDNFTGISWQERVSLNQLMGTFMSSLV